MSTPPVRLRVATEADIAFFLRLRQLTMGPHRMAAGAVESEEQTHAKARKDFDVASIVLHGDDERIGVFKAKRDRSPWFISQIQLLPEWQGRGIGTGLIARFVVEAREHGETVELGVLKVNPARRMYERLGFKVIAEDELGFTLRTEV